MSLTDVLHRELLAERARAHVENCHRTAAAVVAARGDGVSWNVIAEALEVPKRIARKYVRWLERHQVDRLAAHDEHYQTGRPHCAHDPVCIDRGFCWNCGLAASHHTPAESIGCQADMWGVESLTEYQQTVYETGYPPPPE